MYALLQAECFFFPNLLSYYTNPLKVVKEAKFLCLIFDSKLTYKKHIHYLKTSCRKALDILRVVGLTDWGSDRISSASTVL